MGDSVFVVTFHVHYECGDAIGVGLTLAAAKEIAAEHARSRGGESLDWVQSTAGDWVGRSCQDPPWSWCVQEFVPRG